MKIKNFNPVTAGKIVDENDSSFIIVLSMGIMITSIVLSIIILMTIFVDWKISPVTIRLLIAINITWMSIAYYINTKEKK